MAILKWVKSYGQVTWKHWLHMISPKLNNDEPALYLYSWLSMKAFTVAIYEHWWKWVEIVNEELVLHFHSFFFENHVFYSLFFYVQLLFVSCSLLYFFRKNHFYFVLSIYPSCLSCFPCIFPLSFYFFPYSLLFSVFNYHYFYNFLKDFLSILFFPFFPFPINFFSPLITTFHFRTSSYLSFNAFLFLFFFTFCTYLVNVSFLIYYKLFPLLNWLFQYISTISFSFSTCFIFYFTKIHTLCSCLSAYMSVSSMLEVCLNWFMVWVKSKLNYLLPSCKSLRCSHEALRSHLSYTMNELCQCQPRDKFHD